MTEQAPARSHVVLHCELEVEGKVIWSDTTISGRSWDVADERTREAMREGARAALGLAIIRQCNPTVTVEATPAARPNPGSSQ